MSEWVRLPEYEGIRYRGCGLAPGVTRLARFEMEIGVGFGFAGVVCDGRIVWQEDMPNFTSWDDYWTVADAEAAALRDPDHDWQIRIFGPLSSKVYQRQAPGTWVLVECERGFA